ncbi:MAG: DUF1343 domain-containing protein, partial [Gemmatimonadetes bacterium]|nr:DUF1343 domain-containing protein [Gemmatimonadota bacterium]
YPPAFLRIHPVTTGIASPSFGKHAGERCGGVQLHALSPCLRPVTAAFHLLATAKSLFRDRFDWHLPALGIHNFDKLAGSDRVRLELDAGTPCRRSARGLGAGAAALRAGERRVPALLRSFTLHV